MDFAIASATSHSTGYVFTTRHSLSSVCASSKRAKPSPCFLSTVEYRGIAF
jgi:hypothetical protein